MLTNETIHSRRSGCEDTLKKLAPDESELIAEIRAGNSWAEEEFVRRHITRMNSIASRYLRCEQDRADAVQDAFLTAFRALDRFAGQSSLTTWLHRIVVNACLMKLRAHRSRPCTSIEELQLQFDASGQYAHPVTRWSHDALESLTASEMKDHVRACIDRLPEAYRMILIMRDIEQLDTQTTADLLGETTNNVKTRLHRARQALRTLLEPLMECV